MNVLWILTNEKRFQDNCPRTKLPSNAKTNPNQNPNPNQGALFFGAIVWLPPNPKTNSNLDQNSNPNRGKFSSGGNCPDTMKSIFWKLYANKSLIMACLQIYRELLS